MVASPTQVFHSFFAWRFEQSSKQQAGWPQTHFCKVAPLDFVNLRVELSHTRNVFGLGLEHRMLNMCLKKDPALIVRDKDNNSQLLWHREIMMKSSPQPPPPASTPLFSYKVCSHYGQHFEKSQLNSLTSLCQNYSFFINGHNMSLGSLSDQPYDIQSTGNTDVV